MEIKTREYYAKNTTIYRIKSEFTDKQNLKKFDKYDILSNFYQIENPYNESNNSQHIISDVFSEQQRFQIGFDSEWQNIDENSNKILSYQFWIDEIDKGLILLIENYRLTLKEIISILYQFLKTCGCKKIEEIVFVSHYSRAEMFSIKLKESIKECQLKNLHQIRKSIVSLYPDKIKFYDKNKNKVELHFKLRDTVLIIGVKLEVLGEYIEIPKVENKEFIHKMERLLQDDFKTYVEYSIVDSVISVKFIKIFDEKVREKFGIEKELITSSKLSEEIFKQQVDNYKEFLGYAKFPINRYNKKKEQLQLSWVWKLPEVIERGKNAYHAGRNEALKFGYYRNLKVYDYDIKNAYPSAMLMLQDVDWREYENIKEKRKLTFNDVGYIELTFKFKDDIKYPTFPIKKDDKIVFVKEGRTTITIPEFLVAVKYNMLEYYKIIDSIVFKKKESYTIPKFISQLIIEREKYPKNSIENTLYKLAANSFYGKTAQGINEKDNINIRKSFEEDNVVTRFAIEGSILNHMIAAYTTGTIMALVGEYLLYFQEQGIDVLSVTTDGFTIDRELNETELKYVNLLSKEISEARNIWVNNDNVLERKHQGVGYLVWRNKAYLMEEKFLNSDKDARLVARGGIQTKDMDNEESINYLINKFLQAKPGDVYEQKYLSNLRDYIEEEITDLVSKSKYVKINMDYDLKRKPVNLKSVKIRRNGNIYHKVSFDTEPWQTVEEFLDIKRYYENFKKKRKGTSNILQTKADYEEFFDYAEASEFTDTYAKNMKTAIKNKIVLALLKIGVTSDKICDIEGTKRKEVYDLKKRKKFEEIKSGKEIIKKLTLKVCQKYDDLIYSYLEEIYKIFGEPTVKRVVFIIAESPKYYLGRDIQYNLFQDSMEPEEILIPVENLTNQHKSDYTEEVSEEEKQIYIEDVVSSN